MPAASHSLSYRISSLRQRGFTLIEMMVGIVIALVGSLVIFQTVIVSDARTRTTTSGGEAQTTGVLAMYNLERDIRLAGMGFGTATWDIMGCPVSVYDSLHATPVFSPSPLLVPVRITDNGTAPDEITVLYGNSSFFVAAQPFQTSTATAKKAQRHYGFQPGDLVVVAGNMAATYASASCALVQITKNDNPDEVALDHATGTYTNFYTNGDKTANFNSATGTGTTFTSGGFLFNLGNAPKLDTWSIDSTGRVLQWVDRFAIPTGIPTTFQVADGVINLKAQYGIDSNGDGMVDSWTSTDPSDWTTVRAVRVALLVRSAQAEATKVTPSAPQWSGGAFTMANGNGIADWQLYRYRVYEREIPLRNMIWGTTGAASAPSGTRAAP